MSRFYPARILTRDKGTPIGSATPSLSSLREPTR